jgi:hypothetical protein
MCRVVISNKAVHREASTLSQNIRARFRGQKSLKINVEIEFALSRPRAPRGFARGRDDCGPLSSISV